MVLIYQRSHHLGGHHLATKDATEACHFQLPGLAIAGWTLAALAMMKHQLERWWFMEVYWKPGISMVKWII